MPQASGPKQSAKENLIFAYDVGDVKNSYTGEPTTNKAGGVHLGFSGGRWGKTTDYPLKGSLPFQLQGDVYQLIDGNNYWGSAADFSPEYNKTYTLSYWYYLSSDSNLSSWHNSFFGEPQGGGSIYTTVSSKSNDTFSVTGTSTWRYGSVNITTSTPVNSYSYFRGTYTSGGTDNLPSGLIYIANFQLEEKSHPTPFTNSTRSVTQALKPIISNTSIDLSNVSFDANAQIAFDGTDDLIDITTNFGTLNAYTFEYVVYSNSSANMPISSRTSTAFYKYGAYSWRYTHGGVGGEFYHTYGNDTGWAHWVITYDGSTISVWENGVSKGTSSSSGTADFSGGIRIGSWASSASYTWDGKIPIMKMYNRALTATEVQQNYKSYKTRFKLS